MGEKKNRSEFRIKIMLIITTVVSVNFLFVAMFIFDEEMKNMKVEVMASEGNPELEDRIREMTKGHPIENMAGVIARKDEKTAALLVSIAKKESNWGKRSPKLNGEDCFNYWGFRLVREKMGTGGHTCFNSPQDAVNTVARRIKQLTDAGYDTPAGLIVWKCGYSCEGHSNYSVNKWISDVDYYYRKFTQVN